MNAEIEAIEKAVLDYERGRMMRSDSEAEIDLFDGKVWLCDYSESRGSAEFVKDLCREDDIDLDELAELCDRHGWAYVL